ncbi:MAG: tryptophan synthase subunit alpha [Acidobacteria bacterium]|nr:tryptophan synthase subunit alpha [Acidobacteriota bacterium]MBV9477042.1 tryptophan synthase subunit alpha [Acidobacteriota bacterium]
MKRVETLFRRLKRERRCGLIAYVTCGDGDTGRIVDALARAGADAIELGIPFSDPIADGPVIQAASQRALQHGTTTHDVFAIARAIRALHADLPLIAFSYLNPILRYGARRFAHDACEAGIDAVLLTDLPPEAAAELRKELREEGLGAVFLLAPTSTDARIRAIDRASDGFVYYVSTTGVTGARRELDPSLLGRLDEVRAKLRHPIAVGFGISRHEHYELLREHCDAIVVGSAIVRAIGEGDADGAAERAANVVRGILDTAILDTASIAPVP